LSPGDAIIEKDIGVGAKVLSLFFIFGKLDFIVMMEIRRCKNGIGFSVMRLGCTGFHVCVNLIFKHIVDVTRRRNEGLFQYNSSTWIRLDVRP